MSWFLVPCLVKLRHQINEMAPGRSMRSDGSIGDRAHSARRSDHNPDSLGAVRAIDITDDPRSGCSAQDIADALVAGKDPRVKYIIWNREICVAHRSYKGKPAWTWQPYGGSNPHTKHIHISVRGDRSLYNDSRPWRLEGDKMNDFLDGKTGHIVKIVKGLLNKVLGCDLDEKDGTVTPELRAAIVRWNSAFGFLPNDETLTVWAYDLLVGKAVLK